MKELLIKEGLADEKTVFIVTASPITRFSGTIVKSFAWKQKKHGFIVSYDGLEL